MSIVEQVQKLQYANVTQDIESSLNEYEKALDKYRKLVEKGALIPRKNNLQNNYNTKALENNLKYSNI